MLSYAGVYLISDTPPALADGGPLSLADLHDFVRPTSPGRLASQGFPYLQRARTPKLHSYFHPTGLSRFGYGYFLTDDAGLAQIRPQAYGTQSSPPMGTIVNGLNPLPLVIDDGNRSITVDLYMLPPRPLASCLLPPDQQTGPTPLYAPTLWLLTLVDARYFWPTLTGTLATDGRTWANWFADALSALGATGDAAAVPAAYGTGPTSDFGVTNSDGLLGLLDAAAYSVGLRVVYDLDGTVHVLNSTSATTRLTANAALVAAASTAIAGFALNIAGIGNADDGGLLPHQVVVEFPTSTGGTMFTDTVTLASLALPGFTASIGGPGSALIRLFTPAVITSDPSVPDNSAALTAMARQAATDYYQWLVEQVHDGAYDGVLAWQPTGAEDSVEWAEKWTVVRRPPWNERVEVVRPEPSAATVIRFVRLTGLPGSDCTSLYLDGYLQAASFTGAEPGGSGAGSGSGDCALITDGQRVDVIDFNNLPPGTGSGSGA